MTAKAAGSKLRLEPIFDKLLEGRGQTFQGNLGSRTSNFIKMAQVVSITRAGCYKTIRQRKGAKTVLGEPRWCDLNPEPTLHNYKGHSFLRLYVPARVFKVELHFKVQAAGPVTTGGELLCAEYRLTINVHNVADYHGVTSE